MRIVRIKYLSTLDDRTSSTYFYKDTIRGGLKKYDTVIVPTKNGMSIATVVEAGMTEEQLNSAGWDTGSVKTVLERVKSKTMDNFNKSKRANDIKKKLDEEVKKLDKMSVYRTYAENSPAIAEMLSELESLSE